METTVETYGKYKSARGQLETQRVTIGKVELYFSYKTLVAINDGKELIVSENQWSNTTGKHLDLIAPAEKRVKKEVFEEKKLAILGAYDA